MMSLRVRTGEIGLNLMWLASVRLGPSFHRSLLNNLRTNIGKQDLEDGQAACRQVREAWRSLTNAAKDTLFQLLNYIITLVHILPTPRNA